jgi:hypothetical protein
MVTEKSGDLDVFHTGYALQFLRLLGPKAGKFNPANLAVGLRPKRTVILSVMRSAAYS